MHRIIPLLYIALIAFTSLGIAAFAYLHAFSPTMFIITALMASFLIGRKMILANT